MSANGSIYAFIDQNGQQLRVKDTSLNFRGDWSALASYVYKDVADYGGDNYIALVPVSGSVPPTNIWPSGPWSGLVLIQQGTTAPTPAGATSFLELSDAPAEYGTPGQKLVVAQNGTTLAFAGPDSLLDLSDAPDAYGQPGDRLVVASNGTSVAFASPSYFRAFGSFLFIATSLNVVNAWQISESSGLTFDGASGIFTCVTPGLYRFDAALGVRVLNAASYSGGAIEASIRLNGTTPLCLSEYAVVAASAAETTTLNLFAVVNLAAGNTVSMYTNVGFGILANTDLVSHSRYFSGFRIA